MNPPTIDPNFEFDYLAIDEKPKENIFWRGVKITLNYLYETPALVIGLTIAAIASHFFIPILAPTLYTLAATTFISKLVIKLCGRLNYKIFAKVESSAWNFKVKYPRLQTIALIVTITAGYVFPLCGIILAIALGIYNGIVNEVDYYKKMQQVRKQIHDAIEQHEVIHLMNE